MDGRNWLGFGTRAPRDRQGIHAPAPNLLITQSDMGACPTPTAEQRELPRSCTQIHVQQTPQKAPRLSRISSIMGVGSVAKTHATTATSDLSPEQIRRRNESMSTRSIHYLDAPHHPGAGVWQPKPNTDGGFLYKEADSTWHNPSLTQMMETVLSTIMSNGISEPIPCHLNSFVIGIVEEFRIQLGKERALEAGLENVRTIRKKEIQGFAVMADEWKRREAGFKAEIKRLEQVIAEKDGMQSVVVARAGSVYNRNDTRAFQVKLNRMSKSEDDIAAFDPVDPVVMVGEMESFAVLPIIKDSIREIVLDHNADALMSELYRSDARRADKRKISQQPPAEKLAAAQRFHNNGSKVRSPRKSESTASSSAVPSSASSSLSAQIILDARANQDHVTPHTTPAGPDIVRLRPSPNILGTIQELMKTNHSLIEDVIDDASSYDISLIAPSQTSVALLDPSTVNEAVQAAVEPKDKDTSHNGPQRPLSELGPAQVDGVHSDSPHGRAQNLWKVRRSPNSDNSANSQSSRLSATMVAMAHNCVDHAGQSGGLECPRNSPTKMVRSGTDPIPDETAKYRFRTERTVLNASLRERSYATTQELRAVMDDRNYQTPDRNYERRLRDSRHPFPHPPVGKVPHKTKPTSQVAQWLDREALLPFPPGFEAHPAAGLLPFQQVGAQRAVNRTRNDARCI